jgi:cell division protein FtsI/penicillin-binding protein 2
MPTRSLPAAVALLLLVTACTGGDPDPADAGEKADGTAAALVEGLAGGDLDGVTFTETSAADATADYETVVEGMDGLEPTVELGDVEEDGDSATATVSWSWPVTEEEGWDYDSEVELERVDDEWQVVWGHQVVEPSLNAASVLDLQTLGGGRGEIVGNRGLKLVTERPVVRVGIDRTTIPGRNPVPSAQRLAALVGIDVGPYARSVKASGEKAFVEAIVFRDSEVPPAVSRGVKGIPGAVLLPDELPLAPTRTFAAEILGTVGPVTAEMIKQDPELEAGDEVGLSGLQARYDEQLRGESGTGVVAVGSDGTERRITEIGGKAGEPLKLSMDVDLQTTAESLLAGIRPASSLVAIRPSDGAILVAANGPGNDGQNFATFGQYAPGSTFKVVSSLALLRSGLKPDDVLPCEPSVVVDGKRFENYDDYPSSGLGRIPFRTALANSCNTAFISARARLAPTDLPNAAASLGFGVDHDVGFPAFFGSITPPASETEGAADLIGQGKVLASPMAMATVLASVVAGKVVVPHLVDDAYAAPPEGVPAPSAAEARQLQRLLRGVVTNGSGRGLADLPGPPVLAKTGTAEFGSGARLNTHAWMIGAQGDLAVAVFVGVGSSGSGTAGPILEAFLRAAR